MTLSAILSALLPTLLSLVGGYMLNHWGISLPALPKAQSGSGSSPVGGDAQVHVTRLQAILGISRAAAGQILQDAFKKAADEAIKTALADLAKGQTPAPSEPAK